MSLTLVPTPIGNLEDITLRALRVLREADIIACEDTRTSGILLRHYGITDKKLISFHVHNENDKLESLLERLRNGENIAVISDAGTPGISDPGWILLKRAIDEGIDSDVLPGPSALIPAVLMSGLPPQPFMFIGFPPDKHNERINMLDSLKGLKCTLCFYVSPHKAEKHIADMIDVFGNRRAALIREISKIFQEAVRDSLSGILKRVINGVKGELVLVIEGCNEYTQNDSWKSEAQRMNEEGLSVKDIVKAIETRYNVPKNEIKKYILSV